jgi:hypothetical protein
MVIVALLIHYTRNRWMGWDVRILETQIEYEVDTNEIFEVEECRSMSGMVI